MTIKSNFEGLADNYSSTRPHYPQRLLAELKKVLPKGPLTVVDLASGTGISARAVFKALGNRATVVGIEPSEDMRRRANEDTDTDLPIHYREGKAEDLGVLDISLDLIFVGQALHWFDRPAFYAEVNRSLKPGGVVAIARNTRNWRKSNLVAEYEAFHEKYLPGFSRTERELDAAVELEALEWCYETRTFTEEWVRAMNISSFLGMAQSSSKITQALHTVGWNKGIAELTAIANRHLDADGFIALPYSSVLICAMKANV